MRDTSARHDKSKCLCRITPHEAYLTPIRPENDILRRIVGTFAVRYENNNAHAALWNRARVVAAKLSNCNKASAAGGSAGEISNSPRPSCYREVGSWEGSKWRCAGR